MVHRFRLIPPAQGGPVRKSVVHAAHVETPTGGASAARVREGCPPRYLPCVSCKGTGVPSTPHGTRSGYLSSCCGRLIPVGVDSSDAIGVKGMAALERTGLGGAPLQNGASRIIARAPRDCGGPHGSGVDRG